MTRIRLFLWQGSPHITACYIRFHCLFWLKETAQCHEKCITLFRKKWEDSLRIPSCSVLSLHSRVLCFNVFQYVLTKTRMIKSIDHQLHSLSFFQFIQSSSRNEFVMQIYLNFRQVSRENPHEAVTNAIVTCYSLKTNYLCVLIASGEWGRVESKRCPERICRPSHPTAGVLKYLLMKICYSRGLRSGNSHTDLTMSGVFDGASRETCRLFCNMDNELWYYYFNHR